MGSEAVPVVKGVEDEVAVCRGLRGGEKDLHLSGECC